MRGCRARNRGLCSWHDRPSHAASQLQAHGMARFTAHSNAERERVMRVAAQSGAIKESGASHLGEEFLSAACKWLVAGL
jgi:hypothetical protein